MWFWESEDDALLAEKREVRRVRSRLNRSGMKVDASDEEEEGDAMTAGKRMGGM